MPASIAIQTVYLLDGPPTDEYVVLLFLLACPFLLIGIGRFNKSVAPESLLPLVVGIACIALPVLGFVLYDVLVKYPRTIDDYRAHRYQIVEGCLTGFDAGKYAGHSPDSIVVGGRVLNYADAVEGTGFNQTEAGGGPIHANTWVRLYLVGDSIVRVDAAQKACPPAPRFPAQT